MEFLYLNNKLCSSHHPINYYVIRDFPHPTPTSFTTSIFNQLHFFSVLSLTLRVRLAKNKRNGGVRVHPTTLSPTGPVLFVFYIEQECSDRYATHPPNPSQWMIYLQKFGEFLFILSYAAVAVILCMLCLCLSRLFVLLKQTWIDPWEVHWKQHTVTPFSLQYESSVR